MMRVRTRQKFVWPLLVLAMGCVDAPKSAVVEAAESPDLQPFVAGNTAFAFDLYGELKKAEGNLFFSPYSLSSALAMTYAGARGETASQMAEVLHFRLPEERLHPAFASLQERLGEAGDAVELSVANALWGQRGTRFLEPFLARLRESHGAGLREVDFAGATEAARQSINDWTAEETRQRIRELIRPGILDASTRLVLTNAIYFKGRWAAEFDPAETEAAPFTCLDGREVEVPMMHQKDRFRYAETPDLQVLELPYQGDALSLVVLLPRRAGGLGELEAALTAEALGGWLPAPGAEQEVVVYLPKFEITAEFRLDDALQALGMTDAFELPPADFSGMTGAAELYLSAVVHKAFVAVDEEGTEAAAASAIAFGVTGMPAPPTVFRADHPFVFLIRDNESGSVLFLGRVAEL